MTINKNAMDLFVNNAINPEEMMNRISNCIAVECYMFNLATEQLDEPAQAYHEHKIRGLALAVNCMGASIYVRHRNDMSHHKIEYFTLAYNGEILMEVRDFRKLAEEAR